MANCFLASPSSQNRCRHFFCRSSFPRRRRRKLSFPSKFVTAFLSFRPFSRRFQTSTGIRSVSFLRFVSMVPLGGLGPFKPGSNNFSNEPHSSRWCHQFTPMRFPSSVFSRHCRRRRRRLKDLVLKLKTLEIPNINSRLILPNILPLARDSSSLKNRWVVFLSFSFFPISFPFVAFLKLFFSVYILFNTVVHNYLTFTFASTISYIFRRRKIMSVILCF